MSENEKPKFQPPGSEQPQTQQADSQQADLGSEYRQTTLDDLFQQTAVASRGGVTVTKVKEQFEAIATDFSSKSNNARKIYVAVADEAPLRIPACILYSVVGNVIYTYPLILESCGEILEPRQVPGIGGKLIMIDMPTARYFNPGGTMNQICDARALNDAQSRGLIKQGKVKTISSVVIKNNIDLEDKNALAPFFDSAVAAISAQARNDMNLTTSDLTCDMLVSKQLQLVSRNRVTPGNTDRDPFGSIVSQDFKVDLLARAADRNTGDLHTEGREAIISSVTGYLDFAYHTPDQMQQQNARVPNNTINIPAYDPYIVITSATPLGASTQLGDNLLTQCFALASISGIAANQRWVNILTRSGTDSGEKTSIGALALEHDPNYIKPENPQVLNVTAGFEPVVGNDAFTPLEVVQKFCYNNMLVAMDIEHGGPMSWVQSVFANATPGSHYEALIIKELDRFSNGVFSQIWDRTKNPILAYDSVDVHLGYYTKDGGIIKDLRSLDYLSMLVATNGDINVMGPYTEGFQPGRSTHEAMNAKRDIIKAYASNAVFTGIATRIFFNTAFINALEQMFSTVQLRIILEGINDIVDIGGRTSAFDNQAFNAPIVGHGAFHQNYSTAQGQVTPNYFQNVGFGR